MHCFEAHSDRQFCICLRMLFDESIKWRDEIFLNNKKKANYRIYVDVDDATFKRLHDRYEIMIS